MPTNIAPLSQVRPNNPDICGFYFFPYDIIDEILAKDHNFQARQMHMLRGPCRNCRSTLAPQSSFARLRRRCSGPI
eukprot:scaffold6371_cov110-Isochrysis_galbana.AAC.4